MMLKNKRFFLFVCLYFTFLSGLQSQDYVTDLRKANQLLSVAQERDRLAAESLQEVKSQLFLLEEDLAGMLDNSKSKPSKERKKLENEIKALHKKEQDLLQRRKYANNLLLDVTDILQATSKKRSKFIAAFEKRYGVIKLEQEFESQSVVTNEASPVIETSKPIEKEKSKRKTIAELERSSSVPPEPFVGSDVIAPAPTVSDEKEIQEKTKKSSKTKAVASKDSKSNKKDTKSRADKKTKKESEAKESPAKEVVAAKSVSKDDNSRKKKDKRISPTMTRPESSKTAITYKNFDPKEDVMAMTPSSLDCNLAFDGKDNFTGKKKQETEPIILFAHTDDFMRAAMKGKDFVTCEATATRVEGSRIVYLNLTITIQTKDAQRTFGFLDRGAFIIFRLINGKRISLATNKTDIGVVDAQKGTTTFRAQLAISETSELTQSELDTIRVSWSVGYEDYEIYDMDVLRNLFKCLDKK